VDTYSTPVPSFSILPAVPYPDSLLSTDLGGGWPDYCEWSVNGEHRASGCPIFGEELGLVAGDLVSVHIYTGSDERSEETTIQPAPGLAISEAMSNSVSVLTSAGESVAQIQLADSGTVLPISVIADAEAGALWVTTHLDGTLSRIELDDWTRSDQVVVSSLLYWGELDADRDRLLVADQGLTAITPVSRSTLEVGAPIAVPMPPVTVRVQGDRAWIASREGESPTSAAPTGYVSVIDLTDDTAIHVAVGEAPYHAEPDPAGERVAVADQEGEQIIVVDAETLETLSAFDVPGGPTGVAWDLNGERLVATLYGQGLIVELDAETGKTLREWDVGLGAVGAFLRPDGRWMAVPVLHKGYVILLDMQGDAEAVMLDGVSGPRAVAWVPAANPGRSATSGERTRP